MSSDSDNSVNDYSTDSEEDIKSSKYSNNNDSDNDYSSEDDVGPPKHLSDNDTDIEKVEENAKTLHLSDNDTDSDEEHTKTLHLMNISLSDLDSSYTAPLILIYKKLKEAQDEYLRKPDPKSRLDWFRKEFAKLVKERIDRDNYDDIVYEPSKPTVDIPKYPIFYETYFNNQITLIDDKLFFYSPLRVNEQLEKKILLEPKKVKQIELLQYVWLIGEIKLLNKYNDDYYSKYEKFNPEKIKENLYLTLFYNASSSEVNDKLKDVDVLDPSYMIFNTEYVLNDYESWSYPVQLDIGKVELHWEALKNRKNLGSFAMYYKLEDKYYGAPVVRIASYYDEVKEPSYLNTDEDIEYHYERNYEWNKKFNNYYFAKFYLELSMKQLKEYANKETNSFRKRLLLEQTDPIGFVRTADKEDQELLDDNMINLLRQIDYNKREFTTPDLRFFEEVKEKLMNHDMNKQTEFVSVRSIKIK